MPSTLTQANNIGTTKPPTQSNTKGSSSSGGWIGAAASVVNNLVSNIFGQKKINAEIKLKQDEQKFKSSLSTLDNQQKFLLNIKLNNAKTKTERLKILEDSLKDIQVARISKPTNYTMPIILVSCLVGLVATLLIVKKDN